MCYSYYYHNQQPLQWPSSWGLVPSPIAFADISKCKSPTKKSRPVLCPSPAPSPMPAEPTCEQSRPTVPHVDTKGKILIIKDSIPKHLVGRKMTSKRRLQNLTSVRFRSGFHCSKQWQPPRTGRNRRSTGGWVLKPPLSAWLLIVVYPIANSDYGLN